MIDTTLNQQPARRFDFARCAGHCFFVHARYFRKWQSESRATWLTPMLVLTITAILVVVVAGYLKIARSHDWEKFNCRRTGNIGLPTCRIITCRRSKPPRDPYSCISCHWSVPWQDYGWDGCCLAALLHFGSTLLGGRGSMQGALNIVAWASLPFAVRDILRIVFMLSAGHAIISPGLSGFVSTAGFVSQLLTRLDIFLIWNVILLVIGFGIADSLPRSKAVTGVLVVILLVLLAQAGLGALSSSFGGTAVQRPFF